MSSGIASLHKILKDETRRKIILLLHEKGNLSYTDLMDTLGIVSTGTLNYHLKVLGDLLSKNADGKYTLTEKGKLASRLLLEFPEENDQLQTKAKWQWRFWTAAAIVQVVYFTSILTLYFLRYVDFARLVQGIIASVGGIALAYFAYRMQRTMPEPGSKEEKSRMQKAYPLGGAWLGFVIAFFGTILLSWLSERLGGPNILRLVDNAFEFILVLAVPTIWGGIVGYYFGKSRGFKKPNWMTWLDNRLGF
jgi:DNA-binding transcriptional ArsR family regulator